MPAPYGEVQPAVVFAAIRSGWIGVAIMSSGLVRVVRVLVVMALLGVVAVAPSAATEEVATPGDDAVVVAVLDGNFSPYHYDFLASKMPQQTDADDTNNLPLDQPPHTWLSGFPAPETFASYNALNLSLPTASGNNPATLGDRDAAKWNGVKQSTRTAVNYNWIPGTKIIGALDYGGNKIRATGTTPNSAHGANTSAVATGNIHGTCPECLVVLVTYGGNDLEAANDWALSQPWIDVVTHSYGYSKGVYDKIYSGSNLQAQRTAVERGQSVFWSASNGQANAFDAPTTTYFSSSKGPDWLITVGATSPQGGNFTGSGKTVDLASIGSDYPSMGGTTVNGNGTFSGTSNATPVAAGMLARALYRARQSLGGPSRVQQDGVVASGTPVACGSVRPDCELGDGTLTRAELERRLFEGAIRTPEGPEFSLSGVRTPMTVEEYDFASEGHGTYFARVAGVDKWRAEEERIYGPMVGTAAPLARTAAERDWMRVDSYCRQEIWGSWGQGAYVAGKTALPGPSPASPLRSALEATCPQMVPIP
jgi:hypothetical protein